ncbi:TCR-alpha V segment II-70 [Triplophysa rosa]|nr:TCR-alpha V segment II-70 [Triplophysa rosa]
MKMLQHIVIWILTFADITCADSITPERTQQHHTSVPQFLMLILRSSEKVVRRSDKRLSGKLNVESKRVDLIIPSSTVQDSAVYYCALQTTVTGKHTLLYKNLTG